MNIIELAKEADKHADPGTHRWAEVFDALVRADLMKQVMDTCEAEYKRYDEMVEQDDAGHEEATAVIHLMRKLDKLRPATGKAEREWVDLTDDEIDDAYTSDAHENTPKSFARAVIAAFKEKNK